MNTPPELLPLLDIARQALAPLQAERRRGWVSWPNRCRPRLRVSCPI
jgi:hypothetical protein